MASRFDPKVAIITCAVIMGVSGPKYPVLAQSAVEEKIAPIDWERATSDADRTTSIAPNLNSFRANNSAELAAIKLPVLVPNPNMKVVEGSPRILGQGNSYVAAYTLPSAKLSILGTSVFLTRPDDQALAQGPSGTNRIFDRSADGSDLTFLKYGASYVLRLSCAKREDERCSKDAFLNAVADNLLVVGGTK
jgi:hypothetical protein